MLILARRSSPSVWAAKKWINKTEWKRKERKKNSWNAIDSVTHSTILWWTHRSFSVYFSLFVTNLMCEQRPQFGECNVILLLILFCVARFVVHKQSFWKCLIQFVQIDEWRRRSRLFYFYYSWDSCSVYIHWIFCSSFVRFFSLLNRFLHFVEWMRQPSHCRNVRKLYFMILCLSDLKIDINFKPLRTQASVRFDQMEISKIPFLAKQNLHILFRSVRLSGISMGIVHRRSTHCMSYF